MDSQSASETSSTSGLDDLVQQILISIGSALASQVRTRLDSDHTEDTEVMLSNFSDYLLQVDEARFTSSNPQSDMGLIFDQNNLLSVHELLKGFMDLDHSSLSIDFVRVVPSLSNCYDKIEEILAGLNGSSSEAPSPTSPSLHYLAGVGGWLRSPDDPPQYESDTANDDNQTHDTNVDTHFSSSFNIGDSLYYDYTDNASLSDFNEAHSSVAVQYSEMSDGEDE